MVSHVTTTSDFSCSDGTHSQTVVTVHFTLLFWLEVSLKDHALGQCSCNSTGGVQGEVNAPRAVLKQQRLGIGRCMLQDPSFKKETSLKCIWYGSSEGPLLDCTPVSHHSNQFSNTSSLCHFQGMANQITSQKGLGP